MHRLWIRDAERDFYFISAAAEQCLRKLVAFLLVQNAISDFGICLGDATKCCAVDTLCEAGVGE